MILKFPDLNTLRLAMTSGAVPPAVVQASAVAGFDDQDQIWVETASSLPRASQNELRKLGVQAFKATGAELATEVRSWLELLPLVPDLTPIDNLGQSPVLFDLGKGEELTRLAGEILRLGNDRQGYRWLEEVDVKGNGRGLLRVVGPPYYSLLRAIDRIGGDAAPRAYVEKSPRVWVELGYTHPLIKTVKAPDKKLLLLRPPRQWTVIDDAPFRDVYEVAEFTLPEGKAAWNDAKMTARLKVALRLVQGGSGDLSEFWVLRGDGVEELNRFVQAANEDLLDRLSFAVGEKKGGKRTVVVRVRPSKQMPPVVVLQNADAYRGYYKMPNLFLPRDTRLHPQLRRDVVRKLLADDPAQVVWLAATGDGSFAPESMAENAFRPLSDWVDYVLDHDHEALETWMQATRFDFEAFVCNEEGPAKPKKPPAEKDRPARQPRAGGRKAGTDEPFSFDLANLEGNGESTADLAPLPEIQKLEPSELQRQIREAEEQFLSVEGDLDAPARQELWPTLANLNSQLQATEEAAVCWLNAMWDQNTAPPSWAWRWLETESQSAARRSESNGGTGKSWLAHLTAGQAQQVTGADLDRLLAMKEPTNADLRGLSAYILWSAGQELPPAALVERLNPVQHYLEKYEKQLPVRALWLAWYHLVRLSKGDVLALARARDRVLERLFHNGLRPEQDLPGFLRNAGQPTSLRFRNVREWMRTLCESARGWSKEQAQGSMSQGSPTDAYIDLVFAYGLAKLGEPDACKELLERARGLLVKADKTDKVHALLFQGFEYRVRQALDGKPTNGPLPAALLKEVEKLETQSRYAVDRMRQESRVFEPDQKVEAYRNQLSTDGNLAAELARMPDVVDPAQLMDLIGRVWAGVPKAKGAVEQKARVLKVVLGQLPRCTEEFGLKYLEQVVPVYDGLADQAALDEFRVWLLERGLFVAGHFNLEGFVAPLVERFRGLMATQRDAREVDGFDTAATNCLRSLRRLGMRTEIEGILQAMANRFLGGKPVESLQPKDFTDKFREVRGLLHVASGWYYFNKTDQAETVLQLARQVVLRNPALAKGTDKSMANPPGVQDRAKLACTYAATLGQAPPDRAQSGLEELFDPRNGLKGFQDNWTTAKFYSRLHLSVVEAVVRAVVSDDCTLGDNARRWLDDDEFLVRRRVHRDVRAMMAQSQ